MEIRNAIIPNIMGLLFDDIKSLQGIIILLNNSMIKKQYRAFSRPEHAQITNGALKTIAPKTPIIIR
ncbi:MAG: hypothetical protein ABIJ45_09925 [Candidatus Zixiibacteriota bacterium]